MTIGTYFARFVRADGVKAAAPTLFGTAGLSGVSGFATAKAVCGDRSGRIVNALRASATEPVPLVLAALRRE
ncbi:hypothetical protein KMZ68_06675 [Bradyrhizobium sediminis]|uniref:Uncharacterized protein n=1 Tax=Bradyrhizobium sediminis TaxID=2840469 RepID=A0A975NR79_9BRAD|nr:hypothetical protein [Bradyrhizobium sediminis]QWG19520.1 hypothetical protein KMZ68_06675 [Bradyrhizobium sediminis]